MDMIGKIRRMHGRDKKTKREIARATGLSLCTVASTCLVSVARTRYSVPCEWAGHMVCTPTRVMVAAADALVATHERLSGRNQSRYDWQHYVPLTERKPGALRNVVTSPELSRTGFAVSGVLAADAGYRRARSGYHSLIRN